MALYGGFSIGSKLGQGFNTGRMPRYPLQKRRASPLFFPKTATRIRPRVEPIRYGPQAVAEPIQSRLNMEPTPIFKPQTATPIETPPPFEPKTTEPIQSRLNMEPTPITPPFEPQAPTPIETPPPFEPQTAEPIETKPKTAQEFDEQFLASLRPWEQDCINMPPHLRRNHSECGPAWSKWATRRHPGDFPLEDRIIRFPTYGFKHFGTHEFDIALGKAVRPGVTALEWLRETHGDDMAWQIIEKGARNPQKFLKFFEQPGTPTQETQKY